jgi:hypothetical protein
MRAGRNPERKIKMKTLPHILQIFLPPELPDSQKKLLDNKLDWSRLFRYTSSLPPTLKFPQESIQIPEKTKEVLEKYFDPIKIKKLLEKINDPIKIEDVKKDLEAKEILIEQEIAKIENEYLEKIKGL